MRPHLNHISLHGSPSKKFEKYCGRAKSMKTVARWLTASAGRDEGNGVSGLLTSPRTQARAGNTVSCGCVLLQDSHTNILPQELEKLFAKLPIQDPRLEFDWDYITFITIWGEIDVLTPLNLPTQVYRACLTF